jgi:hypothetical protein
LSFQYFAPATVACSAKPDSVIEYASMSEPIAPSPLNSPPDSLAFAAGVNLGTPYRGKRNVTFLLKGIVKWQDFH